MEKKLRKVRFIVSYNKERLWLEEMAKNGWFLKNISLGCIYTFEAGEPRNMMYEIDRFNLPKKPTLEEIRHKEIFMDVASELGWSEVTHDETLTYYFCKEYKEGDINELYNDEESRKQRGKKFSLFLYNKIKELIFWMAVIASLDIVVVVLDSFMEGITPVWYHYFTLVYTVLCSVISLFYWKIAKQSENELSLSRAEWMKLQDADKYKKEKKMILTIRGLNRFLKKQEEAGWILTGVTLRTYFFEKREENHQIYTMDSRWLTNKRQKEKNQQGFKDKKDWTGLNNDWQVQSLKDAEEKGWQFVCALENRAVIYRGDAENVTPLNDAKYDGSLRGISLIGDYGLMLLIAGMIGGLIGFFGSMFGIL